MPNKDSSTYPSADEKRTFGVRLNEVMDELGLRNEDLAESCGVGVNVVSTWRNGHSTPKGRVPWILCQVLGYERWASLWGEAQPEHIRGGRLWTEREVDTRARQLAAEILADNVRQLRGNSQ